jgi:acetyltransferase-like isoleucine patch superfamily enzyme
MLLAPFEYYLLTFPRGFMSRIRVFFYRLLGLKAGQCNRFETSRCRRLAQIEIGSYNSFSAGCSLWPENSEFSGVRIRIGDKNYFNRNVMIDACGYVEIGDENMFGPDIYITDSNHTFGAGLVPHTQPMQVGHVKIGNRCWIGAKAIILKDVELGDGCVVAAGAAVTKSFPANSLVGGVPARLIRSMTE